MKCISLWQPWATLMVTGAKRNETRSWSTAIRGTVAIHAAKKWTGELQELCLSSPMFRAALNPLRPNQGGAFWLDDALPLILPRGVILGTVDILACERITESNTPTGPERIFGDYRLGRFMWRTANARRFEEPIPFTGHQGFFNVPEALMGGQS